MRSPESGHKKEVSEEYPIFVHGKLAGTREELYEEGPDGRISIGQIWKNAGGDPYTRVAYEYGPEGRMVREVWTNGPAENPEGDQREGTYDYVYDSEGNLKEKIFQG